MRAKGLPLAFFNPRSPFVRKPIRSERHTSRFHKPYSGNSVGAFRIQRVDLPFLCVKKFIGFEGLRRSGYEQHDRRQFMPVVGLFWSTGRLNISIA